jgi:hypothetical protein
MKSAAEHNAERQLDLVVDIAGRAQALTVVEEAKVAELRVLVGIGQAILALAEEMRESRAELSNALESWPGWSQPAQLPQPGQIAQVEVREVREVARPDRGHIALAFMALIGSNVLLLILCIILSLTGGAP